MPVRIKIEQLANQSLSSVLDTQRYNLEFRTVRGITSVSVSVNNVVAVTNSRVLADVPLIPYEYQEGAGGNFIFTTENDNIPIFTSFGVTQFLFYLSAAEVADAR